MMTYPEIQGLRYCLPRKRSHGSLHSCSPQTITRLFLIYEPTLWWRLIPFPREFRFSIFTGMDHQQLSVPNLCRANLPLIPATYFHQGPGTSYQSPIKVSHERISLKVADLLAVRCVVKAFKTRCTEKTRILTRQGIINCHPPERQKLSWAIVCPFSVVDSSMSIIERLRYTFTPNGKHEFVLCDQVSP